MPPHNLPLTLTGAAMLWVGWFGFNAGSNLESNGTAALAMMNTFVATAAAALSWALMEWLFKRKPSLLGIASGAIAGLVAVTPASGFAGVMGSMALGGVAGVICMIFCSGIKTLLRYDDSLDVFGVHCIGGIIGALATGLLVSPEYGGTGILDYVTKPGEAIVAAYDRDAQMTAQGKAVLLTLGWSGIGSIIIYLICSMVFGLRVEESEEREGLDLSEHGERAYSS
jgi:Amt family ammonium transporter